MNGDETARIKALRERLATLKRETERREDVLRISWLQRAYGYYIEKGYWREAANLFAEDATFEHGVDGVYVGRDRIYALLVKMTGGNCGPGLPFGQLNEHYQMQPVITLAEDGLTAKGRWRDMALLGQYKEWAAWGDGVYENSYVKRGGVWMFSALRFYPNFVAPYEGGVATLTPVEGEWRTPALADLPPDRPPTSDDRPFPDVNVPPFHYPNPVSGRAWSGR